MNNPTNAYLNPKLVGMRLPSSLYGRAIPWIHGTDRIAWQLLWYGAFTPKSASSVQGGKGGIGKGQNYVYYSAIAALLCAGSVQQLGNVWDSQGILLIQTGATVVTVPGSGPFTVTVTPPGIGSFAADVGAARADTYSVVANDYGSPGSKTFAGTQQTPLVPVASSPSAGQYSVVINAGPPNTATYTFNSADAGKSVTIKYAWQDPAAVTNAKTNPGEVLDLTLFTGAQGQSPWGYLTTNFPSQARGYSLLAYLANPSLYLGESGELPGFTFEVLAKSLYGGGIVDTNPYDTAIDLLVDQELGLQWTPADIDLGNVGGTWLNWSEYCQANGLFITSSLTSQESASSIFDRLLQITNSELVCSGEVMKIVTYGDTTAVGNGVVFSPNTTPVVDLDDDDYLTDSEPGDEVQQDPVVMTIPTIVDAFNDVYIEYLNRANGYNPEVLEVKDDASIAQFGVRTMPSINIHDIKSQPVAQLVASLILQRSVNIRAKYEMTIGRQYTYLEPMDMVTVTDPIFGTKTPVRVLSIDEDDRWNLQVKCEEFPWGTATPTLYPRQPNGGPGVNSSVVPSNVNTPIILEANNRVTQQQGYELWFALSGQVQANWGGCHIWMSTDGIEYQRIFDINGNQECSSAARQGVCGSPLAAGPDPDEYGASFNGNGTTMTVTSSSGNFSIGVGDLVWYDFLVGATRFFGYAAAASISGVTLTFASTISGIGSGILQHGLNVDLTQSGSQLTGGTQSDADNDYTLCAIISSGIVELISFETADLVAQSQYNMHYLRRGQLTSPIGAHAIGDQFVRLDSAIFRYKFDPILIGQTVFFKFTSFNPSNQMEQDISQVNPYSITLQGNFRGVVDLDLNTPLGTTGTIPPILSGALTYVSTTTSIQWLWSGLTLLRPDLSSTSIPAGNVTVSGLTPGTPYFFFPYYDEQSETLQFVSGFLGVGTSSMGAIAQTASSNAASNVANSSYHVPLSVGAMMASTTSSGSGGGGGGGTGKCLSEHMLVESKRLGIVPAKKVEVGDEVRCLDDDGTWTRVESVTLLPHEVFIRVELATGDVVEVVPLHPFDILTEDGEQIDCQAKDLRLSNLLFTRGGASKIVKLTEIFVPAGRKVTFHCEPCHTFFAGEKQPNILTHNQVPVT